MRIVGRIVGVLTTGTPSTCDATAGFPRRWSKSEVMLDAAGADVAIISTCRCTLAGVKVMFTCDGVTPA